MNTAALKREIMDAGTVHSRRYVLPLRFNIPVMFTDKDLWERFGLSEALLGSDGLTLSQTLMENAGDDNIVTGLRLPADLSLLSQPFDYDTETLQTTQQTIADYMRLYQRWRAAAVPGEQALVDTAIEAYLSGLDELGLLVLEGPIRDNCQSIGVFNDLSQYIMMDVHWSTGGFPLYSCTMAEALETLAVEKTYASIYGEERNLACYPFRDSAGCVTASVTYWGALGSGTKVPELGYAFLRQFLEEEFQWDQYRPREDTQKKQEIAEIQCHGQVENSWSGRLALPRPCGRPCAIRTGIRSIPSGRSPTRLARRQGLCNFGMRRSRPCPGTLTKSVSPSPLPVRTLRKRPCPS